MFLLRGVALASALINGVTMVLAGLTNDLTPFLIAWFGTSFSLYGWLYYKEEARTMGMGSIGYKELAIRLRIELREAGVLPGQRLPSAVDYALAYNTTRTTVVRALKVLEDDGIVDCVRGRGTYLRGGSRNDFPKDRVVDTILAAVEERPAGTAIPSVDLLMQLHNASRMTVHRAQRDLVIRGIIERTRSGRYVKAVDARRDA